jgi:hypothetical protein
VPITRSLLAVTRPILVLALVLALAACGGSAPSSQASRNPGSASPSAEPGTTASPTAGPGQTGVAPTDAPPTEAPLETEPAGSVDPGESAPPEASGGPSASPSGSARPAAACAGNNDNRRFYENAASAVTWALLCPVLPKGWFVTTGNSWLAHGGKLEIGYRGPAGATLQLSEGWFCADATGCVPSGVDGDGVPLGPLSGTLVRLDDGGFAIVVDRGLKPSWVFVTHGLDEATTLAFGAAMAEVVVPG